MLAARGRDEGLQDRHVRRHAAHRRLGRDASRSSPARSSSLIGESGSGKTTVGRMILRLTASRPATITFDGQDVSTLGRRDLRAYYGNVQGVFQDPFSSYNPVFKVDRVLEMIRATTCRGLSREPSGTTKRRASLEAVGLEPGRRARQVPAPVERRAAAAPADRARAAARDQVTSSPTRSSACSTRRRGSTC